MNKLIVTVVLMFVVAPTISSAGMLTFMAADQAAQEARRVREIAEANQRGGSCEVKADSVCTTGCAIRCPDGVAALCTAGVTANRDGSCSVGSVCSQPPKCVCQEKP